MKAKRLSQIYAYVSQVGICSYDELIAYFNVSPSTIRRDIDELVQSNALVKKRGGVMVAGTDELSLVGTAQPPAAPVVSVPPTLPLNDTDNKIAIARKASQFVQDHDIIFLGSGTTVAHMVPFLANKKGLYIITNNLLVLNEIKHHSIQAMVIGGNLNIDTMSIVGVQSIHQLQTLNANKAFLGCNGITTSGSVTNVSELEADIKKEAMSISNECFLLTESQKFGKMSLYTFANLEEFSTTITDTAPAKEFFDVFQSIDRKFIIAQN